MLCRRRLVFERVAQLKQPFVDQPFAQFAFAIQRQPVIRQPEQQQSIVAVVGEPIFTVISKRVFQFGKRIFAESVESVVE